MQSRSTSTRYKDAIKISVATPVKMESSSIKPEREYKVLMLRLIVSTLFDSWKLWGCSLSAALNRGGVRIYDHDGEDAKN